MDIEEAKRRAKAGPGILIIRRLFALLVAFVSTVTIARLVRPSAFGLANMSTIIFSFAAIFRDFGLTNAVLRKGHISQSELTLIFWFNAATTLFLSLVIAILSPFIADFYGEPIVRYVVLVSLAGFLVNGLTLQHRAMINRDLRFTAIAVTDTVCSAAGLALTIVLALMWHDVWSIVLGGVFQAVLTSVAYVVLSGWRPGRFRKTEELRSLLQFGGNSSVYALSIFVSQNISAILIGRMFDPAALGQYNRAQAILNLPTANLIQPITQAILPLMTRLRAHPEEYRLAYLSLTRKLCVFLMPMAVALTFASVPLTMALLGDQWRVAGQVLMALSPVLGVLGLMYAVGDLFVTQDRSAELRNLGLFEMVIRVASVCVGLLFGLVGAAAGYSIGTTIVGIVRIRVAGRTGPVTTRDQFSQALPSLPLIAGACLGGIVAIWGGAGQAPAIQASGILGGAALTSLAVGLLFARTRAALYELAEVFGLHKLAVLGTYLRRR
ncbi:lipopolysaccharide biosynthesis protein [Sphingomonas sp. PB2P19]|uniref:lipopolysaccharide biosynthesis protein n=1 Tax=Sphingomonas rhamnosi TaxID=3096156 RepID=UPI002FCA48A5